MCTYDKKQNTRASEDIDYKLPDPLVLPDGGKIKTAHEWFGLQRPRILEYFQREVYGRSPSEPFELTFETRSNSRQALNGLAIRKEIRVKILADGLERFMDILIYLPRIASGKPVPLFLGLNFSGNHSVQNDSSISLSERWISAQIGEGIVGNRATQASRGSHSRRWPVKTILEHGFGLATVYYGDLYPDHSDGFHQSVQSLFQIEPQASDHWGAIATWAWGLQQVMDYFEKDEQIDQRKITLLGHSRLGKAALWAGALDTRFSVVIANNSGCMGAALSRRRSGETIRLINDAFPYWFCENFKKYNDREDDLQVDQHFLIALIAPRPVYIASAEMDVWADPLGEFLAARAAGAVYSLCGGSGFDHEDLPLLDNPILDTTIGYHIRHGKHDLTEYDWEQFLKFINKQMT